MRRVVLLGMGIGLAIVVAAVAAFYWYQRPSLLHVAVVRDSDDQAILAAAAQEFVRGHEPIRLKLVVVDTLAETSRALDDGRADLAVVRSDVAMPETGQTILIMRKSVAVLVAPAGAALREIDDLRGHKIGILHAAQAGGAAHQAILDMVLAQRDIPSSAVRRVALAQNELRAAVERGDVDVVMALGVQGSNTLADVVNAVAEAGGAPPVFIPIEEAKAIAQRSALFQPAEVVRGAFGGAPPRPAEDFETLGVTTRLVASRTLGNDLVGDLVRLLLDARPRIGRHLNAINRMEAPPTDKDAMVPAHPGAIAYLDDETQGFFDRYSDAFYIGAMFSSLLVTGLVALVRRLERGRVTEVDRILARLVEILHAVRDETNADNLDRFRNEADCLLARALAPAEIRGSHANHLAALDVAMSEIRQAINDRRTSIAARARALFPPRLVADQQRSSHGE